VSPAVRERTAERFSAQTPLGAALAYALGVGARRVACLTASAALAVACGARTELYVPVHRDAAPEPEAGPRDAGLDVLDEPPEYPPLDPTKHDADLTGCPATTYVYAVATNDMLLRFDPPSATFAPIAQLMCPANGAHPFSMAVDRAGTAFIEYDNGMMFAVSTADGSCKPTTYVPDGVPPFGRFGMGYATIGAGPDEQLFLASDSGSLGILDPKNGFSVTTVGVMEPVIQWAELTGTGDGRLFAYWAYGYTDGSYVAELDKSTGAVIAQDSLPDVNRGTGWAFAFWGGDFWLFTTPDEQTTVRYDPATKTATTVAHYAAAIVGAGVSTCAPN